MIICETKQVKQVPCSKAIMIGGSYRAPVQAYVCQAFICIPVYQAITNMFYTDKQQRKRAS
ncbi:hypothetical protein GHT06_008519 [Daphnia sinensis]|uniref:Uncharacterized protein n=1 Tax=Daphnia sinensis TaxID=1820382 RepID=A0AAD5Q0R0_9CRUS|nr:hypothetical protein GHT06_008519 [Daphnia sinensis]